MVSNAGLGEKKCNISENIRQNTILNYVNEGISDIDTPDLSLTPKIVGITHQSVLTHWQADEFTDSTIEYGLCDDELLGDRSKEILSQKHTLQLVDLTANTKYFFRFRVKMNKVSESVSEVFSFKTRAHPQKRNEKKEVINSASNR